MPVRTTWKRKILCQFLSTLSIVQNYNYEFQPTGLTEIGVAILIFYSCTISFYLFIFNKYKIIDSNSEFIPCPMGKSSVFIHFTSFAPLTDNEKVREQCYDACDGKISMSIRFLRFCLGVLSHFDLNSLQVVINKKDIFLVLC